MRVLVTSIAILVLTSCSAGKVTVARSSGVGLSRVAVVLDEAPLGTRPERLEAVRIAVEQALHTKGYSVLSRGMVATVCKQDTQLVTDKCNAGDLLSRFDLDGVGHLKLVTVSSNNFLVGYVASISGVLSFEGRDGKILEEVKHRESENSGVLANSGQILGALSSQADAFSGDTFAALASAFGRKLVDQLGAPEERANPSKPPEIRDVKIMRDDGLVRICVIGTDHSLVSLESSRGLRFSLREGDAGTYCGAFRFLPPGVVNVRLNDQFGVGAQQMITPVALCSSLDPSPSIVNKASTFEIRAQANKALACDDAQSVLYVSPSPAGPFKKLAVLKGNQWRADPVSITKLRSLGSDSVYAFIPSPARVPTAPVVKRIDG